ncbi:DUF4180 domain-containing protein [Peptostreptococcus stomatis]
MKIEIINEVGLTIGLLNERYILQDEQSALDIIGELSFVHHVNYLVVPSLALDQKFFDLSTGLAGCILQKFVNYQIKVAIIGDFSSYTSEYLHEFINEVNQRNEIIFALTLDDAINKFLV